MVRIGVLVMTVSLFFMMHRLLTSLEASTGEIWWGLIILMGMGLLQYADGILRSQRDRW